jgi:hypothetical protein
MVPKNAPQSLPFEAEEEHCVPGLIRRRAFRQFCQSATALTYKPVANEKDSQGPAQKPDAGARGRYPDLTTSSRTAATEIRAGLRGLD